MLQRSSRYCVRSRAARQGKLIWQTERRFSIWTVLVDNSLSGERIGLSRSGELLDAVWLKPAELNQSLRFFNGRRAPQLERQSGDLPEWHPDLHLHMLFLAGLWKYCRYQGAIENASSIGQSRLTFKLSCESLGRIDQIQLQYRKAGALCPHTLLAYDQDGRMITQGWLESIEPDSANSNPADGALEKIKWLFLAKRSQLSLQWTSDQK